MLSDDLFVSAAVHERKVALADGQEHLLYFKEVSVTDFQKFQFARQSEDDQKRAESMAYLIAASLCEPDGKQAITFEKALTLKVEAANAIFAEVVEVSRMGKQGND